jgi:hypothetical protein
VVDFSNPNDLVPWLRRQPREFAVVIAARAALRAVPALASSSTGTVLPVCRAVSVARVASAWPEVKVGQEAAAAAAAADDVAEDHSTAAMVARAAAWAAYAAARTNPAADAGAAVNSIFRANIEARDDVRAAVSADAAVLVGDRQRKLSPARLAVRPLWPNGKPLWATTDWRILKRALNGAGQNWKVWTAWYDDRLDGIPGIEVLEVARVLEVDDATWRAGPKVVNARIKGLIAKYDGPFPSLLRPGATSAELAEVVSPAPSLTSDKRLDAGPNPAYDTPTASADLPTLPIRQRALIRTILSGLPAQAPAHLKITLQTYDDELLARGVQPILGLLKDLASVLSADVGDPNARREWLAAGVAQAFENFFTNHDLFTSHFPLDSARDELYIRTLVDESAATGHALARPFEEAAKALGDAHRAGLTTDDFVKIVGSLTDFAKVTSTLPPPPKSVARSVEIALTITPEDRIGAKVGPTKRTVLTGIGFFERVYNLVGSTASIAGTPQGVALMDALNLAVQALSRFLM